MNFGAGDQQALQSHGKLVNKSGRELISWGFYRLKTRCNLPLWVTELHRQNSWTVLPFSQTLCLQYFSWTPRGCCKIMNIWCGAYISYRPWFFFSDAVAKSPEIWLDFVLFHKRRKLKKIFIGIKTEMKEDDLSFAWRSLDLK